MAGMQKYMNYFETTPYPFRNSLDQSHQLPSRALSRARMAPKYGPFFVSRSLQPEYNSTTLYLPISQKYPSFKCLKSRGLHKSEKFAPVSMTVFIQSSKRMPQKNLATEILLFDFELFIGDRFDFIPYQRHADKLQEEIMN